MFRWWAAAALAVAAVAPARPAAGPEVWALSSLETVRPRHTPRGTATARLQAARGEWENFQLVVRPGTAASIDVQVGPLVGPGGATIAPRLYRIGFLDLKIPSSVEGSTGPWPDPLIPSVDAYAGERRRAFPVAVAAGDDAAAWIELFVPPGAPAGDYRGEAVARAGRGPIGRVQILLTVLPFALPATSSLPVTFGFSSDTAARGHYRRKPTDDEALELARLYGLAALRHRLSLHGGTMEAPSPDRDGALDFTRYDREVGQFLDGTADPRGPAAGARWTAIDLRIPARLDGAARDRYVIEFTDHLHRRGWLDRAFYFVADEPPDAQLPWVRARAEAMARVSPSVPRLVTRPRSAALAGAVDLFCPVVNQLDDRPGGSCESPRAAYGERLWWYQSCLSHGCNIVGGDYFTGWPSYAIDAPPVAHRVMEWLTFAYRVGGELYYDTVDAYRGGDPWRDAHRHGGNGDGTLFYPGRPDAIGGATHVPVESIRLKRIRDGLEDYEYFQLLTRSRGREAALAEVRRVALRTFQWEHDPAKLLEVRSAIARQIVDATRR
jgi:hypothetical protein